MLDTALVVGRKEVAFLTPRVLLMEDHKSMKDILIQAAVVLVASCAGCYIGTALSTAGPKKRIRAVENSVVQLTGIVIQIIELNLGLDAENDSLTKSLHKEMCTKADCGECE